MRVFEFLLQRNCSIPFMRLCWGTLLRQWGHVAFLADCVPSREGEELWEHRAEPLPLSSQPRLLCRLSALSGASATAEHLLSLVSAAVARGDSGVLPQRQDRAGGLQAGHEDGPEHAAGAFQAAPHPCHARAGGFRRPPVPAGLGGCWGRSLGTS